MPNDRYSNISPTPNSPASDAFAIVPGTDPLSQVTNAIYVGTGGDVKLRAVNSAADVTYKNVPSGAYLSVRASYVYAVGTTASNLVGEA